MDRHEVGGTGIKVRIVLDDTSRIVLVGGEFSAFNIQKQHFDDRQAGGNVLVAMPDEGDSYSIISAEFGAHRIYTGRYAGRDRL
jgi:hypothetical protein